MWHAVLWVILGVVIGAVGIIGLCAIAVFNMNIRW